MAEWFMPFAPPQQQAEEAVTREPAKVRREWDTKTFLLCSHCREPIEHGEQCMEFLPGVSGFGAKSGRPAVVDCEQPDFEMATLHIGCIYNYVFDLEETLSYQDPNEEVTLCPLCGEGTLGASPSYCSNCGAELP